MLARGGGGGSASAGLDRLEKLAANSGAGKGGQLKRVLRYLQRHSLVILAMVLVLLGLSMSHGFHDLLPSNRPHATQQGGIQGSVHSSSISSSDDAGDVDDVARRDEEPVDVALELEEEPERALSLPKHKVLDSSKSRGGGAAKGGPRGDHLKGSGHPPGARHREARGGGGGAGDTKAAAAVPHREDASSGRGGEGLNVVADHQEEEHQAVQQQHHAAPHPRDTGADLPCGKHGTLTRSTCLCSVLFSGPKCEVPFKFPASIMPRSMTNWSADFEGEMVINRNAMKYRENLSVHLPGKEQDPDHGFRVLAEGSVLDKLLKLVPEEDVLSEKVYKSCAIVGSSGIVLNYDHGADIDQHEMVWRFNSAPTKGYENHVGSKTTHRITNTQNWGFQESAAENILIHFRATSAVKGIFWNAAQKKPIKLYAFDPTFVEYMAFGLDFMATSGLYGIMIALQRCAKVDLYGFQVSTAHGALYHYYDVCDVPANTGRDDSEYTVVKAIVQAGLAKFSEPCIIECHNSAEECDKCKEDSDFRVVSLPSDKKCDPNRVSRGHLEVPWRRNRGKHKGGRR